MLSLILSTLSCCSSDPVIQDHLFTKDDCIDVKDTTAISIT